MDASLLTWLLGLGFAVFALGAVAAVVPLPRQLGLHLSHLCTGLGSGALAIVAAAALTTGSPLNLGSFSLIAGLVDLRFHLDALSAVFVLLTGALGAAGSVYAIGYVSGAPGPSPAMLGAMWNLFIGSMAAVALAVNGLGFLLLWELMSVASFLLVIAEHRDPEVRQAGYFYAVMTRLGTAFLVGAFLVLYARAGSLDFAVFRGAAPGLSAGLRNALFLAVTIGFGTKAGLVPLHVWLPRAHPAAPSHVSALMSGAMVKTAVYGQLRFAFDILGAGPPWWGGLLVALGAGSAVAGALYATQQGHLKRLLAYSTIENVGLLFMGIGAALLARSSGLPDLTALALGAVLVHSLGHAAFKGLAFMGAGAVLHGAGTADMERLGGLIRRMPRAAVLFLVAVMGMAGLPPFAGFIGEWLSLQTFLRLAGAGTTALQRLGALTGAGAIALTAGLVAAASVKAFGISFLALPRSREAEHAHDASPLMLVGMCVLAAAVLGLGVLPGPVLALVHQAVLMLMPGAPPAGTTAVALTSLQPMYAPAALLALGALALLATLALGRGRPRWRRSMTWTCGIEPTERMEYSGAGFSKPVLLMFRGLLQSVRTLRVDPSAHPLFPGQVRYQSELKAVFELNLYRPVTQAVMTVASRLGRLQTGSLQTYLLYLLLAAVGVIIWAR